jgi:hypothetical protein
MGSRQVLKIDHELSVSINKNLLAPTPKSRRILFAS